ncbi:MAG: hypothetical protein GY716_17565 [bacterium]|nr:hypothetical protein [bacterium]
MDQDGLRRVLWMNAGFSLFSGIVLLLGAGGLANLFGASQAWPFRAVGFGLLVFAIDIARECRKPELRRFKALYFSLSDLAWVVGSAILLALAPLPVAAALLVGAVMLIVLGFGLAQFRCLRGHTAGLA